MPQETPKDETTNAVLKEMMISLTKITDERFLNLKESLSEIKLLMQGFATRAELEEVKKDFNLKIENSNQIYNNSIKRIEEGFSKHNLDDQASFGEITKGQKEVRDIMLKWIGGLTLITIIIPVATWYLSS